MRTFSRRVFLKACGWVGPSVGLGVGCSKAGARKGPRVIILGFDGVEPTIVEAMLSAGELPNLAKLRDRGGYQRLGSTIPPQSPTAWSSFATCKRPGNHGIYDFLRRSTRTYLPSPGFGVLKHPDLAPDGAVARAAHGLNYRKGSPFWVIADKQGARCKLLHIPFAFPPDDLAESWMLCGESVPDIRGFTTTFVSLSDAFTPDQLREQVAGGVRIPLKFEGDAATVMVAGAVDPRRGQSRYVEIPMKIIADRENHRVRVEVQQQSVVLAENTWSPWLEWTFAVTPKHSVQAISRIHILEVGPQVRLYMTSLQFHPKAPYAPFTDPENYSAELADRYGLYKTLGWAHDTHALRQDALTEEVFLDDVENTDAWLERLTLDEVDRGEYDLLIAVWTSTDRVAHMFWRFRDPHHPLYTAEGAAKYGRVLEDTYKRMDRIVGAVMAKSGQDDLLITMSDHGFHSFRKGFSVNTWLVRNGYLTIKGQTDAATAYTTEDQEFLQGFDWSKTKAYGLGLGSLYLNLKGRESQGTVAPEETSALIAELRDKLLQVTDPETGERILNAVYTREEYKGIAEQDAPDLQLGYADGYQTSKSSAKGSAPKEVFEPNTDKWSGEHAASDTASSPGVLFANKPLGSQAAIIDIGVTTLKYLGLSVPPDFEGKSLL